VLIPEPEEEMLVRANVGVLWFQVEVRGIPVHVREMAKRRQRHRCRLPASLPSCGGWRRIGTTPSRPRALRRGRAPDQPQHRQDSGWRLGLLGAVLCRMDCRIGCILVVDAAQAAKEISDRLTTFAHHRPFMSNDRPRFTFNGFYAEGYVQVPGNRKLRPSSAKRMRPRPARSSRRS
jgi:acetylornithine deacetylase